MKIIKGTNSRGITNREAGKDGMKMVFLQVRGPFSIGSDLKFHGEQDGAEHIRRKSWSRSEVGITVGHDDI